MKLPYSPNDFQTEELICKHFTSLAGNSRKEMVPLNFISNCIHIQLSIELSSTFVSVEKLPAEDELVLVTLRISGCRHKCDFIFIDSDDLFQLEWLILSWLQLLNLAVWIKVPGHVVPAGFELSSDHVVLASPAHCSNHCTTLFYNSAMWVHLKQRTFQKFKSVRSLCYYAVKLFII